MPFFKKARVSNFADIIKIATIFMKTAIKDKKVEIIWNYVFNCNNQYMYFLMQQNLLIFGEKMLMSAELE